MHIEIREYKSFDRGSLLRAMEKLHDYMIELDPIKRLRKTPGYVEHEVNKLLDTVAKQEGKIYIADDSGKFCGFIAGFTMQQTEEDLLEVIPSKLGVMSDLYLEEEYRNKQIGGQLMQKIEEHLKSMGCDAIWIDIFAYNTGAHRFYKKHGYIDREVGLMKKL